MRKLCKLQMMTTGAWKDITRFDAADEEHADDLMNAAAQLADVVNDSGDKPHMQLRITTADGDVLMLHADREHGWRDARTGEPA